MSGYTDETLEEQGTLSAHVNFIQKPFSPRTLAIKVHEMLDRAKGTGVEQT